MWVLESITAQGPLPSLSFPVPWALRQHCLCQATKPLLATPALDLDLSYPRVKSHPRSQEGRPATSSRDFPSHPSLPSPWGLSKTATQGNNSSWTANPGSCAYRQKLEMSGRRGLLEPLLSRGKWARVEGGEGYCMALLTRSTRAVATKASYARTQLAPYKP